MSTVLRFPLGDPHGDAGLFTITLPTPAEASLCDEEYLPAAFELHLSYGSWRIERRNAVEAAAVVEFARRWPAVLGGTGPSAVLHDADYDCRVTLARRPPHDDVSLRVDCFPLSNEFTDCDRSEWGRLDSGWWAITPDSLNVAARTLREFLRERSLLAGA